MNGRARVSVPLGDPGDPVILRSCHSERSEESVPLPIRASTDSALRSKSPKGRQPGGARCGDAARLRGLHGAGARPRWATYWRSIAPTPAPRLHAYTYYRLPTTDCRLPTRRLDMRSGHPYTHPGIVYLGRDPGPK